MLHDISHCRAALVQGRSAVVVEVKYIVVVRGETEHSMSCSRRIDLDARLRGLISSGSGGRERPPPTVVCEVLDADTGEFRSIETCTVRMDAALVVRWRVDEVPPRPEEPSDYVFRVRYAEDEWICAGRVHGRLTGKERTEAAFYPLRCGVLRAPELGLFIGGAVEGVSCTRRGLASVTVCSGDGESLYALVERGSSSTRQGPPGSSAASQAVVEVAVPPHAAEARAG
eukprot:scaffold1284_cov353-Prasinococcus_capsulatus_cf.AAC.7